MRQIYRIPSILLAFISAAFGQENELAESKRFIRGENNPPAFQSFVIPLDSQKGVALNPMGDNATTTAKTNEEDPIPLNNLFTLNFDRPPPWRSIFIHQPHFEGKPLPSAYQGKSLEELLQMGMKVTKDLGAARDAYLQVDNSPELLTHPILDKLVEDMGRNPMALSNYVHNEIGLVDAISYNDQGQVNQTSINVGGMNRVALATYLEGQGNVKIEWDNQSPLSCTSLIAS